MAVKNFPVHKKGFSLVEMITVIAIMAFVLPSVFAIVFAVLKQQVKIYRLTEVKRQGDIVFNTLSTTIRNDATEIYSDASLTSATQLCNNDTFIGGTPPSDGTALYFKNRKSQWFHFVNQSSTISLSSSTGSTYPNGSLTSSKIRITNFQMFCKSVSSYSVPVVYINFTVMYNTTELQNQNPINYNSKIVLRN